MRGIKKRFFKEAMNKGTISQHEEMKLLLRNGDIRDIDVMNTDLRDEHGTLIGYMSIGDDVTEEKAARKEIAAWRNRYQLVAASSGFVVYDYDVKNDCIVMSENVESVFGYPHEDICQGSNTWLSLVHPDDRKTALNAFMHAPTQSRGGSIKYRLKHKDGHYVWVEDRVSISDVHTPLRLMGTMADITEKQEAEEALRISEANLRTANNKLNLLSSITRHDISNSLSAMQGFLSLMEECEDHEVPFYIPKMQEIARSIQNQISFSFEYEAVGNRDPRWFFVQGLLELIPNEDIRIISKISPKLEIYADPMLPKAFYNLFMNAKNHGQHVSSVTVTSSLDNNALTLIWQDDGIGVPPEEKEKIFIYGYGKNTGFGLYLIKEILKITSITICENGEIGTGARFEIQIPAGGFRFNE